MKMRGIEGCKLVSVDVEPHQLVDWAALAQIWCSDERIRRKPLGTDEWMWGRDVGTGGDSGEEGARARHRRQGREIPSSPSMAHRYPSDPLHIAAPLGFNTPCHPSPSAPHQEGASPSRPRWRPSRSPPRGPPLSFTCRPPRGRRRASQELLRTRLLGTTRRGWEELRLGTVVARTAHSRSRCALRRNRLGEERIRVRETARRRKMREGPMPGQWICVAVQLHKITARCIEVIGLLF